MKICSIYGIPLRLSISFPLLPALIMLGFVHEKHRPWVDWSLQDRLIHGALVSVFISLSILVHELAHCRMASRFGVRIHSITLGFLGGCARTIKSPRTAAGEFCIAIAGPFLSVFIALVSGVLFWFCDRQLNAITLMLLEITVINLMMGVFNLLPIYPMDGGRILHGVLWWLSDNRFRSLRWTAIVAMPFAIAAFFYGFYIGSVTMPFISAFMGLNALSTIWVANYHMKLEWELNLLYSFVARGGDIMVVHDRIQSIRDKLEKF